MGSPGLIPGGLSPKMSQKYILNLMIRYDVPEYVSDQAQPMFTPIFWVFLTCDGFVTGYPGLVPGVLRPNMVPICILMIRYDVKELPEYVSDHAQPLTTPIFRVPKTCHGFVTWSQGIGPGVLTQYDSKMYCYDKISCYGGNRLPQ